MSKRLIVNADDFGWSGGVSKGILRAHREGIVTSTTLMANMPSAERALSLLAGAEGLGVGVHLNVCQGPPLTPEAREALAGPNGLMDFKAPKFMRAYVLSRAVRRAVAAELDAQVCWALDRGIRVTHLDSHRHVHAFPPVFALVKAIARRYKIGFVRWPRERLKGLLLPEEARPQRRVARLVAAMMRLNGLRLRRPGRTDAFFGIAETGILDAARLRGILARLPEGLSELMVHPGLTDAAGSAGTRLTASREVELAALCDPAVRAELERQGIELTHYGRL